MNQRCMIKLGTIYLKVQKIEIKKELTKHVLYQVKEIKLKGRCIVITQQLMQKNWDDLILLDTWKKMSLLTFHKSQSSATDKIDPNSVPNKLCMVRADNG